MQNTINTFTLAVLAINKCFWNKNPKANEKTQREIFTCVNTLSNALEQHKKRSFTLDDLTASKFGLLSFLRKMDHNSIDTQHYAVVLEHVEAFYTSIESDLMVARIAAKW